MKYNVLTVANENYSSFIKLFVNSFFEFCDQKNVENIYIFDTGLSEATRAELNCFPKVVILDSGFTADSSSVHDNGWAKNTYSKTVFLLQILKKDRLPTLMIDSDSIFANDFEHVLDWNSDFAACDRNREGFSRHIGSFFAAIDIEKSIEFVNKWIENLEWLQNNTDMKHCESPALSKTISETDYKVQEIEENLVSAVFPTEHSLIYHLKSDYYAMTVEKRLALKHAQPYVQRYL